MNWQPIITAPEGVVVETKIDDRDGIRNVQTLKRQGGLWFFSRRQHVCLLSANALAKG